MPDLPERLIERLSASDRHALLLEVFRLEADKTTPQALLAAYQRNPFVQPAAVDVLDFRALELLWLRAAKDAGFEPLELSPVGPLGSCSAVGTVHQHKVLSALRGTEVVADCTNMLALEASLRRRSSRFPTAPTQLCAAHRHVRTQQINVRGFTPHFGVFGLATAGRNTGGFHFEKTMLARHIGFYLQMLRTLLHEPILKIALKSLDAKTGPNRLFEAVQAHIAAEHPDTPISVQHAPQAQQQYYRALQFGIVWEHAGNAYTIIDGGFTDWTQRLAANQKERFLGSAIGLEFFWKLQTGQIG